MASTDKWVWFDLDDTLHDFSTVAAHANTHALRKLAQDSGQTLETVTENFRAMLAKHFILCFADGRTSHEYRTERFRAALGMAVTPERANKLIEAVLPDYESMYMNGLALKQGALDLLQALRSNSYRLAILTDGPEDSQQRVIDKLGIRHFFDEVFTSGRLRLSKKNGMCRRALENLKASPANVVMIGDSIEKDVEPALAAKIGAIWFNEKNAPNGKSYRAINALAQLSQELQLS